MSYIKENIKDLSVIFLIIVWTACKLFIDSSIVYIITSTIVSISILFLLPLNYQRKVPKHPRLRFQSMQHSFNTMIFLAFCASFINYSHQTECALTAIDIAFFGAFIQSVFFLIQKWYFNK